MKLSFPSPILAFCAGIHENHYAASARVRHHQRPREQRLVQAGVPLPAVPVRQDDHLRRHHRPHVAGVHFRPNSPVYENDDDCETTFSHHYDSGETKAASTIISHKGAPWIQLDLSRTKLAENAYVMLTGETVAQKLNSTALESIGHSAAFDGSSVSLELVSSGALRYGELSRLVVSAYRAGVCDNEITNHGICGELDDRVPSTDPRVGRIGQCTGWLISEDVFVTAGHCAAPDIWTRVHFTYGAGPAPIEDQYAVDVPTYRGFNDLLGNDWAVGRLLPNSRTNMLPGDAQGGWYTIGQVPSGTEGNNVRITGYGRAAVDSKSQKTSVGPLVNIGPIHLSYIRDTTGGDSGGPVIHEETGHAIGIHTHGACRPTDGHNSGTRIDRTGLAEKIDFLTRSCDQDSDCDDDICEHGKATCDGNGQCQFGIAPSCPCRGKTIKVGITTDNYPTETSWTLINKCSNGNTVVDQKLKGYYVRKNTAYPTAEYCADDAQYEFTINDSYGDGICCSVGSGSYTVVYDGDVVIASRGAFGFSEVSTFGNCSGTLEESAAPTGSPTKSPATRPPTKSPVTRSLSRAPTGGPTRSPSSSPSRSQSGSPSKSPATQSPTKRPVTGSPSKAPAGDPTHSPLLSPSMSPSSSPTKIPITQSPTKNLVTESPPKSPTDRPTRPPSSRPSMPPSGSPTKSPATQSPTTSSVTESPSKSPTGGPTQSPSLAPSMLPLGSPTKSPARQSPTKSPSSRPSIPPTSNCVNDMTWLFISRKGRRKNCNWIVSKRRRKQWKQCKRTGVDGRQATEACPKDCNDACAI